MTIGLDFHPQTQQHQQEHDFSAATDPQLFTQQNRTPSLTLEGSEAVVVAASEPPPAGVPVVSGVTDMMALQLADPRQNTGAGSTAAQYFASATATTAAAAAGGDLSAYSMPVGLYDEVVERYGWGTAATGGATTTTTGGSGSVEAGNEGVGTAAYQY